MGMFSKLRNWFSGPRQTAGDAHQGHGTAYKVHDPVEVSRFGAVTNRINAEQWLNAHNNSINNDIQQNLATVQARCAYEYGTNPNYEGVCNTFKDDVVGRNGPMLQVMSDSEEFNNAVEAAFRTVFEDPDPSHRLSGVEDMKTWVHSLLNCGSYYTVQTRTERLGSRMTFGWRSVHARRFVTPADLSGDPNVAFGCRYDPNTGAPVEYYPQRPSRIGGSQYLTGEYDTVPASAVQHCFLPIEAEQLTGYPMMASTLETAADIRTLDKYVLESMKFAAANSPYLNPIHPELAMGQDPLPVDSIDFQPGQVPVAPPGYAFASPSATQPSAEYMPFKHEKAAELGRPIHMPLLVVLLTAAESNFSAAQYEGTVYADGIAGLQGTIERRSLNRMVRFGIIPEVLYRSRIRAPKEYQLVWTWNVPAHANIEKYVKAIRMMIEDGLISQAQGSALLGYDWEKVVASRKKCAETLDANDLPPAPANAGSAQQMPAEPGDDNEPTGGRTSASRFSLAV